MVPSAEPRQDAPPVGRELDEFDDLPRVVDEPGDLDDRRLGAGDQGVRFVGEGFGLIVVRPGLPAHGLAEPAQGHEGFRVLPESMLGHGDEGKVGGDRAAVLG